MTTQPQPPLTILFAGEQATAAFVDGQSFVHVFVRALPERYLLNQFLQVMEDGSRTVELCVYTAAGEGAPPLGAFPAVPPPAGYWPVPIGWADNLTDESLAFLYEKACQLNFSRAARLAEGRLAAKQAIGPLETKVMEATMPVVSAALERLLSRFSTSMPKSPPSPATPATTA